MTEHHRRSGRKDSWKCRACNVKWQRTARRGKRQTVIDALGGKCSNCGYNKCQDVLCFHHLRDKEFEICMTNIMKKTVDELLKEAEKCVLLCMNCHAEVHAGVAQLAEASRLEREG